MGYRMRPPVDSVNRCRTFQWQKMVDISRTSSWELLHGSKTNDHIWGGPILKDYAVFELVESRMVSAYQIPKFRFTFDHYLI